MVKVPSTSTKRAGEKTRINGPLQEDIDQDGEVAFEQVASFSSSHSLDACSTTSLVPLAHSDSTLSTLCLI